MKNKSAVRISAAAMRMVPIANLVPYANNAKIHSPAQIAKLRASLREFGFVSPVLIDGGNNILAGHGRVLAAQAEGMAEVPCVLVTELSEAQRKAYILADNRLAEDADWDDSLLRMELDTLAGMDFNVSLTGFDAGGPIHATAHDRATPGQAQANSRDEEDPENSEYQAFVEKFKPKKTTDDCYTPEPVYKAVRTWAVQRYGLEGRPVVRPFYPGGDYERFDYPEGCVVIDNPPFSILSQICRTYEALEIPFFLFAPTLTLFSTAGGTVNYLPTAAAITYENGAKVNTSFLTNLGDCKIEMAPDLYAAVSSADADVRAERVAALAKYIYPPHLLSVGDFDIVKHGVGLRLSASDVSFVRALDAQREADKAIYGAGFLLSEKAAAEKAAAEKWQLSEREWEIVHSLG